MSCPDCMSGSVHLDNPTGAIETIHGLPVYVARPEEGVTPKGIIIYIPDAFGIDFVNNKILADHYAKRGNFLVYLPDFMGGYSLPITALTLMDKIIKPASWLTTLIYKPLYVLRAIGIAVPWLFSVRQSVVKPRILSFLTALRTSPPPFPIQDLKIGAAGFCWGGFWTIYLCNNLPSTRVVRHPSQSASTALEPLIDCGFTAHPSNVSVPKDIDGVELPLSVAVGEDDMAMKGPLIQQMKEILEVKKKGDHEVIILPGAKHGFAVRSHPEDKVQLEHAETAEVQAVAWFKRWLA